VWVRTTSQHGSADPYGQAHFVASITQRN
jgi:hypothetical protein